MKYGPHDVVKAKRDLKVISDEVVHLLKVKEETDKEKKLQCSSLDIQIKQRR